jgi:hypothetical protein
VRRIISPAEGERGGIAIIVAILMVVLLGFAAVSIDVAKLYSERAQLQNGSDAVALAAARNCATVAPLDSCAAISEDMQNLANGNAVDGLSNVKSIALDKASRTVHVTAGAEESGATTNSVSLFFAGILGFSDTEVTASSIVQWGSPVKGTAPFPITVSICQVRDLTGVMQRLQLHGSKNGNTSCPYGPSGATVPGGFGGLKEDTPFCGAAIDIDASSAGGNTGNDPPKKCDDTLRAWAADMQAGKEVILLLPIFNAVTGQGDSAVYKLTTIAAFRLEGWKLGSTGLPYTFRNRYPDVPSGLECREPCRGFIGTFVEYVSLADGYTMGPVNSDGATIVELTD